MLVAVQIYVGNLRLNFKLYSLYKSVTLLKNVFYCYTSSDFYGDSTCKGNY